MLKVITYKVTFPLIPTILATLIAITLASIYWPKFYYLDYVHKAQIEELNEFVRSDSVRYLNRNLDDAKYLWLSHKNFPNAEKSILAKQLVEKLVAPKHPSIWYLTNSICCYMRQ